MKLCKKRMCAGSSLRYKSFCLGIVVTSVMWAVAIYLYVSLTDDGRPRVESGTPVVRGVPSAGAFAMGEGHSPVEPSEPEGGHGGGGGERHKSVSQRNQSPGGDLSNRLDPIPPLGNGVDAVVAPPSDKRHYTSKRRKTMPPVGRFVPNAIDELGLVKSPVDQRIREEGYRRHAFNVLVSNRLSFHRPIPDVRHALCKEKIWPANLPTASIIICFYNEASSALMRTVYSVLDRTPDSILHEIILVDDFSSSSIINTDLNNLLKNISSKVVILRAEKREGLIRARMIGAKHASGQVLAFLDSHCEVNQFWLEPLLERIVENRTNVVCPIIDIINTDTFGYTASPLVRGGFNWGLHFKWDSLPAHTFRSKADYIRPIASPTMAGGLFAIDRDFFVELGEYDPGMDIWGGENLEISFRIWMCGGRLEIVPCSHVGHIFRKRRPYGSPSGTDTMLRNSLRVAHVWLDEYKDYFFQTRPDAVRHNYGDISDRVALRKRLQCQSFDWFIKNVYPELKPPVPKGSKGNVNAAVNGGGMVKQHPWKTRSQRTIGHYQLQLSGSTLCLQSEEDATSKGSLLLVRSCRKIKTQAWFETEKHELLLAELLCLDAGEKFPRLAKCHEMGGPQEWKYSSKDNATLYNLAAGQCLGVRDKREGEYALMEICTKAAPTLWNLVAWKSNNEAVVPDKYIS